MSGRLQAWARLLDLPRTTRDVLCALADHAREDGSQAHPGVTRLAYECDLSERQVQRILRRLELDRIVQPSEQRRKGGSRADGTGYATIYQLDLSKGRFRRDVPEHSRVTFMVSPLVEQAAPASPETGARVTFEGGKGDISTPKGDILGVVLTSIPTSIEPPVVSLSGSSIRGGAGGELATNGAGVPGAHDPRARHFDAIRRQARQFGYTGWSFRRPDLMTADQLAVGTVEIEAFLAERAAASPVRSEHARQAG